MAGSSVVAPGRTPASRSAWRTQLRSVRRNHCPLRSVIAPLLLHRPNFVSFHAAVYNIFNIQRHLICRATHRRFRADAHNV